MILDNLMLEYQQFQIVAFSILVALLPVLYSSTLVVVLQSFLKLLNNFRIFTKLKLLIEGGTEFEKLKKKL